MKIKHIFIAILVMIVSCSCDMSKKSGDDGNEENYEQQKDTTNNERRRRFFDEEPENRGQNEDPLEVSYLYQSK